MQYKHAPAMVNEKLTQYYDFFVEIFFVGKFLQGKTLRLFALEDNQKFLDVGCGTGTLICLVKEEYPKAEVTGVDPDKTVLAVAKNKIKRKGLAIDISQTGAENLPFPDNSFDIITSSLAFHHMPTEIKQNAIKEIHRALKNTGIFFLVDIGRPKNMFWKILCSIECIVEPKEYIRDNLEGKIPQLMKEAGFKTSEARSPYLGIYFWKATK